MRAVLTVLVLALGLAGPAYPDDPAPIRRLMTGDDSRGWEGVGRVDMAGRGMCTGALIAPDLVLTAAHCLYDKRTHRRFSPDQIEFLAGLRHGRAAAYRGVVRAIAHPEYVFEPEGRPQVRNDLAILQLDLPVENGTVLPFAIASEPSKGDAIGVVSYAHDRAESPGLQQPCHVLARRFDSLVMSCEVDFGSSGAPVFVIEDGVPRIASVVSAKAQVGERRVALGPSLDGTLEELLAQADTQPRNTSGARPTVRRLGRSESREQTGAKFVRP